MAWLNDVVSSISSAVKNASKDNDSNSNKSSSRKSSSPDPYNELSYLKKTYETGSDGKKSWAANEAKKYYNMLDPDESKKIQGMNAAELASYVDSRKSSSSNSSSGPYASAPSMPSAPQAYNGQNYVQGLQQQINNMYDQQRQAQLEQLRANRDKAVGELNQQKSTVAPQYQQMRNQTDAVNLQNVQRLREAMASAGLTASGENVTAQVAQNNQRQANLNQLNLQEQQTVNDLNRRISDLQNPADENALMAQLEAERARALLDFGMQADQIAYGRSRDSVMDSRYLNELAYGRYRDTVGDERYADELDYSRDRDAVADQRYWNEFNYNKDRDAVADQRYNTEFEYQKQMDAQEKAWREYTYNNMSATEKAQLDWAKAQFGENMAWQMYAMEYEGNLQQSMAQAQLDAYSGFNGGGEGGGTIDQETSDYYSQYRISSPFGMRKDPFTGVGTMHNAIDIAMPKGANIPSTVGGTVLVATFGQPGSGYGGYGNVVVVKDAQGNLHQYSHLDSINVKPGQKVGPGVVLGKAGSTGRSTGPHLDYSVKNSKGTYINPTSFLTGSHDNSNSSSYRNMWKTQKEAAKADGFKTFQHHLSGAVERGVPKDWATGLTELIGRESTWNWQAKNSSSSAYGYGQLIDDNVKAYEKKTGYKYSNPIGQIIITSEYVKDRYGSPEAALRHHDQKGWY